MADKYNVPASGIIKYRANKITPIVYVKNTNSLVWENACGSGSLVYSIYSSYSKIIQPSKQEILVKRFKKSFTIKVPVKIVE